MARNLSSGHTTEECLTFFKKVQRNQQIFVKLCSGQSYIGGFVELKERNAPDIYVVFCNSLNTETGKMEDRHIFHYEAVISAEIVS